MYRHLFMCRWNFRVYIYIYILYILILYIYIIYILKYFEIGIYIAIYTGMLIWNFARHHCLLPHFHSHQRPHSACFFFILVMLLFLSSCIGHWVYSCSWSGSLVPRFCVIFCLSLCAHTMVCWGELKGAVIRVANIEVPPCPRGCSVHSFCVL